MSDNPLTGGGWPSQEDLRRRDELNMKSAQKECLDFLGITPDQLLIARSLDREKIFETRNLIYNLRNRCSSSSTYAYRVLTSILELLPTFPDEEKP